MPDASDLVDSNSEEVDFIYLEDLLLDESNPRFGLPDRHRVNQTEILDYIVTAFGVDDVISSLAVNGYFRAEPLVCKPAPGFEGKYIVAEGNRRLAACLILNGEERAANHHSKTTMYSEIHRQHNSPSTNRVPAIVFRSADDSTSLLSYLGVRHIASAQQWDSYAKAVWIKRVVSETALNTEDVAAMIGDKHRTVSRLLEGYNYIDQLITTNNFDPKNSVRRGRGSNTTYPFSWVYTILGYSTVRAFLNLGDDPSKENPIPEDKLEDAELLTKAMFGDSSRGRNAAINDSRQLSALASAVSQPEKVLLLRSGKALDEVSRITQPIDTCLGDGLLSAKETLGNIHNRLIEQPVDPVIASTHVAQSAKVSRLATEVEKKLHESISDA